MWISHGCFLVLLTVFCLLTASCQATEVQTWRVSDPSYVPFTVTEMAVSADNRFVGLTVDERANTNNPVTSSQLNGYVLDLKTGEHRKIGHGNSMLLPTPGAPGHEFLYYDSEDSPILLLDGLQTARSFEIGRHSGGWWNRKNRLAIFATAWPNDREGFNAIALLNTISGEIVRVRLNQPTELLTICPTTGKFYTESSHTNSESDADEYDSTGVFMRHLMSPLVVYSASCRYVVPFAALSPHGPDDWAAFESSSGSKLMDFPWSDEGKTENHLFSAWNPRRDNLLLIHSQLPGNQVWTNDVVDLEQRTIVKRWADSGAPVIWSGDGAAMITIRDHHIIFEQSIAGVLKD